MSGKALFWRYLKNAYNPVLGIGLGIAFFYGIFVVFGIWSPWLDDYRVRTGSGRATGQVVRTVRVCQRTNRFCSNLVTVQYGGRTSQAAVDRRFFATLSTGETVTVRYIPSKPGKIWIEGDNPGTILNLIFSLPILILPTLLGWWFWQTSQRMRRLQGTLILGEVVEVVDPPAELDPNLARRDLRYAFTSPDGVRREGRYNGLPDRVGIFAQPGDPIQIAYDPANPDQHEPDIFGMDQLRRAARPTRKPQTSKETIQHEG